jgi:hypothetical protein
MFLGSLSHNGLVIIFKEQMKLANSFSRTGKSNYSPTSSIQMYFLFQWEQSLSGKTKKNY